MFYKSKKFENIDKLIDDHISMMHTSEPGTDEYTTMAEELKKLYKAKSYTSNRLIDPNTLLTVGANILGIVLIMSFEKTNVITSKAFGWIRRV